MQGECLFTIKKAEISHLEQIKEIESECGLSSWSAADYRQEILRQDSIFYICEIEGQIGGFILARLITTRIESAQNIMPVKKNEKENFPTNKSFSINQPEPENEVEIYNIGIRKKYRRMSFGNLLLKTLLKISQQKDIKKIWLEVRISNKRAIGFYESEGFKIVGMRRSLYTNPPEDGFIMCLNI